MIDNDVLQIPIDSANTYKHNAGTWSSPGNWSFDTPGLIITFTDEGVMIQANSGVLLTLRSAASGAFDQYNEVDFSDAFGTVDHVAFDNSIISSHYGHPEVGPSFWTILKS